MAHIRCWALCVLGVFACTGPAPDDAPVAIPAEQALIYDRDDRQDVYQHPEPGMRALARASSVALIERTHLDVTSGGAYRVAGPTLAEAYDLCGGERFMDQPSVAECSGVLLEQDLVLTAGHCVSTAEDCRKYRFVFDFLYTTPNAGVQPAASDMDGGTSGAGASGPLLESIERDDVYECLEIVVRRHANNETIRLDFAIIRLDRAARNRVPVTVRARAPALGESVATIGCTSGLPVKIDTGGKVLGPAPARDDFFFLDSDTFFGSSGSGVFDADGALLGVIARGGRDYETTDAGCYLPQRTTAFLHAEGGVPVAEEATQVAAAIDALCSAGHDYPRLCAGHTDAPDPSAGSPRLPQDGGDDHDASLTYPRPPPAMRGDSGCTVAQPGAGRALRSAAPVTGSIFALAALMALASLTAAHRHRGSRRVSEITAASDTTAAPRPPTRS